MKDKNYKKTNTDPGKVEESQAAYGSYEKFLRWLRDDPYMLEGRLSLLSLASFEGINNVLTQIGRIEHGIFA